MTLHATQMKTYATVNETQKRSLDEQIASGEQWKFESKENFLNLQTVSPGPKPV